MWDYRVVRSATRGEAVYDIREVYYNPDGSIYAMSMEGVHPSGESIMHLEDDLRAMLRALQLSALDEDTVVFAPMAVLGKVRNEN